MPETGAVQWLKWDTQAGEPNYRAPGLVVGGEMRPSSIMTIRRGIGQQASHFAGAAEFRCSPQIECTADSKALLEQALRGAGDLAALKVHGGTAAYDFLQENAYIASMRISGAVDSPLVATLDLVALTETEASAGGSPEDLTSDLYAWQNASAVVTAGGGGGSVQAFEISLNNNVNLYHSLDEKVATEKRLPSGVTIGPEEIEFTVDMLEKLTWDVPEDDPAVDLGAVISYAIGEDSIEITLTDLAHTGDRAMPFTADGLVLWRYRFIGKPGSLTINGA